MENKDENDVMDETTVTVTDEQHKEQLNNALKKLASIAELTLPKGTTFYTAAFDCLGFIEDTLSDGNFTCVGHNLGVTDADKLEKFKSDLILVTGDFLDVENMQAIPDKDDRNFTPQPQPIPNGDELTDDSPMPFGKHKGKLMKDVPVNYLHWFYTNAEGRRLHDYISRNLSALKEENEDLIWKQN